MAYQVSTMLPRRDNDVNVGNIIGKTVMARYLFKLNTKWILVKRMTCCIINVDRSIERGEIYIYIPYIIILIIQQQQ